MRATTIYVDLLDIHFGNVPIVHKMSKQAQRRHDAALWYAWGREDAGDRALIGPAVDRRHACNAFVFAVSAAIEAERYERGHVSYLRSVQEQYKRFLHLHGLGS